MIAETRPCLAWTRLQALASSRANEVDADGEEGNSPFTASPGSGF